MTAQRFTGKRVLVTGGARGIGRAVVERFTGEGAYVFVADIDDTEAKAAAEATGAAEALQLDVSDPSSVAAAVSGLGALDVVVANAGVQSFAPCATMGVEHWDRVLDVNARGTMLTLQLAAQLTRPGGSAVAIASIQALLPNPLSAHYAASKAAVLSLTRSFAAELAPQGIRVNAVAPGRIDTALSDLGSTEVGRITGQDAGHVLAARIATNPMRRIGHAAEVAAVVAFLASDDASYVTGECVNVCGGDVMA
jgi:NAD(P)-dependent dehydrogenase (short-subunit alcohol dehydrogenase family)